MIKINQNSRTGAPQNPELLINCLAYGFAVEWSEESGELAT